MDRVFRARRAVVDGVARACGVVVRAGGSPPGRDADLCVFDPDAGYTVDAATPHHRNPVSAHDGMWLRGVEITGITGARPRGRLLGREDR